MGSNLARQRGAYSTVFDGSGETSTTLNVSHQQLGWLDVVSLYRNLNHLPGSVKDILITNADLGSKHISWFCSILQHRFVGPTISVLILTGNDIRSNCTAKLGLALATCEKLVTLKLDRNYLDDDSMTSLVPHLIEMKSLHELDLSYNALTDASGAILGELIGGQNASRTLQSLSLDGNSLGGAGTAKICQVLHRSNLTSLSLNGNGVGCYGAHALSVSLGTHSTLQALRLSHNGIGARGIHLIARALQRHSAPYLDLIDFSSNEINILDGDAAVVEWENLLHMPCCALRSLNLSNNNLGQDMCRVLLNAPRIAELVLQHVGLSFHDDTIAPCDESTRIKFDLRVLDVSYNEISDQDVDMIRNLVTQRPNLTTLCLLGNVLSDVKANTLVDVFVSSRCLRLVELRHNLFTEVGHEALQQSVRCRIVVE